MMLDITIESFYALDIYYGEEEFDSLFERELEELEKFSLWYSHLENAGIRKVFIAYEDGQIVGVLTTNADNQAIAIEVLPDFRGQGVASQMLDVARCYCPERNENPEFWRRISLMRDIMREYNLESLFEVKKYILSWRYTKIKNHVIVMSVDYRNYVSFSVDSSVSYEEGYISVALGGIIFRWLERSFREMIQELVQKLAKMDGVAKIRAIAPRAEDIHWIELELELHPETELDNATWDKIQDLVIDCEWGLRDKTNEKWYFDEKVVEKFVILQDGSKVIVEQ